MSIFRYNLFNVMYMPLISMYVQYVEAGCKLICFAGRPPRPPPAPTPPPPPPLPHILCSTKYLHMHCICIFIRILEKFYYMYITFYHFYEMHTVLSRLLHAIYRHYYFIVLRQDQKSTYMIGLSVCFLNVYTICIRVFIKDHHRHCMKLLNHYHIS